VSPEAKIYVERAQGGLDRLAQILTRMSEAARLEQSVDHAEFERFDLVALVRGCVDGYRSAYAPRAFVFDAAAAAIAFDGAPDLCAQMLDKLCANAIEFGRPDQPIVVRVERVADTAVLSVGNDGPLLPDGVRARLFESMVSVREEGQRSERVHLGLGLYIVRLIAEAHRGTVHADNRADGSGVVMTVALPLTTGVPR
jgi:signal transduction histidine kinase